MTQDEGLNAAVQVVFEVLAGVGVGQVSVTSHDPLFDAPGVGADTQHFRIMVRFEQQHLHAAQMNFDGIGHVAKVCGDADFYAFGVDGKTHGINGIVRNGETLHGDVADDPAGTGLELFDRRGFGFLPVNQGGGEFGDENSERLANVNLLNELKTLASSGSDGQWIIFKNWVREDQLDELFDEVDMLLLPSENENFAIAVAQSIVRGVPVVVSSNVALSSFVREKHCGIVIDDISPKSEP